METTAAPFTYNTGLVSKKAYDEHLTLYHGYVNKTNEIAQKLATDPDLASANSTYSTYRALKRGESFALDGVILHELYFQNIYNGGTSIGHSTSKLIEQHFGTFDKWKAEFIASALSARGWCILVYEQRTQTLRNVVLDSHDDGLVCGSYPLLVLDMYEHAYFTDYGTDKAKYINKFLDVVNWDMVERRCARLV